jgi:hypothetical protein
MKGLRYCTAFALLTLVFIPLTADAFSRRSQHSEVVPIQHTAPLSPNQTEPGNVSAQPVPEPPTLLFMGIGIAVVSIGIGALGLYRQAERKI